MTWNINHRSFGWWNLFFFNWCKITPIYINDSESWMPQFSWGEEGGGSIHRLYGCLGIWWLFFSSILRIISFYYTNTNEIPGELSHKNLISSHVKITCYLHNVKISPLLWIHNKSRLSHQKTIKVKWFGSSLVFI